MPMFRYNATPAAPAAATPGPRGEAAGAVVNGAGRAGTLAGAGAGGGAAGLIEAVDRPAAVRALLARGLTPLAVEPLAEGDGAAVVATAAIASGVTPGRAAPGPVLEMSAAASGARGARGPSAVGAGSGSGASSGGAASPELSGRARRHAMSRAEVAAFVRELATALEAGLPLVTALRTMARAGRNPRQRAVLEFLIGQVEQGRTLAEALRAWGAPFGDLVVSLTRAGEMSGKLDAVLEQTADLLDADLALRRALMGATLYPLILCVLIVGAMITITLVIVPRILENVGAQLTTLPWPTRVAQGFADLLLGGWWALALGALGAVWGFSRLRATPGPRLSMDRFVLSVPLLGPLVRDAQVARFTRTLGTLVNAGLPVLTGLRLTAGTLTNAWMARAVAGVIEQVQAGRTVAEPLERCGVFPPLLVQIVSLGERSGRLGALLRQGAKALDDRTRVRVAAVTQVLPPLLILVAAGLAVFVGLAVFLPLLSMQEAVG